MSEDVLFDPITPSTPASAPMQHPRYRMDRDTIVKTTIIEKDDDTIEEDEVLTGWSITDRVHGQYHPIAFVYDTQDAIKILEALNSNGK